MKSYSLFFIRFFIGLALFCLVQAARAQPGGGGPEPAGPSETPIDGGVSLLLAAGVGLGLRRLRQGRAPHNPRNPRLPQ